MLKLSETVVYKYESIEEMKNHEKEMHNKEWAKNDSYKDYEGKTVVEYVKEW